MATGWGPTRRDLVAGVKLIPIVAKNASADGEADQAAPTDKVTAKPASATPAAMQASVKSAALIEGNAGAESKAPAPDPLTLPQAKFLRRVHQGACEVFTTVLGPEANDIHRTHLHLDLQEPQLAQRLQVTARMGPAPQGSGGRSRTAPPCLFEGENWSGRWDLNPRPQPWQGCALPLSYTRDPAYPRALAKTIRFALEGTVWRCS